MAAKTLFENMTAGLALQNVYIQLSIPDSAWNPDAAYL
jgi:hypothetical protein